MPNIQFEIANDDVGVITFDRENSSANVFNQAVLQELNGRLNDAESSKIRALVFISAKPSIFIAGADLHAIQKLKDHELSDFIELGQETFSRIAALKIPTVAAIHGACVGGGYELCLACDYRIASPNHATKIGLPEVTLGILPAWGGSTRLTKLIGLQKSLTLILGGKIVAAQKALKLGMIDALAPREWLMRAALKKIKQGKRNCPVARILHSPLAGKLTGTIVERRAREAVMEKTRGNYPAALKALEVVCAAAAEKDLQASLNRERVAILDLVKTSEARNLIDLFFLQERAKKLTIGETGEADESRGKKIENAAVIGAGVMGAGIAQWLSARGLHVILRDIAPKPVAAGMQRIEKLFRDGVKRHIFTRNEAERGMDRVSPAATAVPLTNCDLVIEAAVEKMDLKKKIFAELDALAGEKTILATNTSALAISEIASATQHPERIIGIHFFNPVHRMKLVEIVRGEQTSPLSLQTVVRFAQQIGKLPVVVRDSPGFLVNRILMPYLIEAVLLFDEGLSAEVIDAAMLDFGMPMGPLRLLDEVGIDVAADVAETLTAKFSGRMQVPPLLPKMMEKKLLGRKSGAGFYKYDGHKTTPNPEAESLREKSSLKATTETTAIDASELRRRLALLMVNEAARCLGEKIVEDPRDVDLAMVMGTGFAPFLGGPLRMADTLTLNTTVSDLHTLEAKFGKRFTPCEFLKQMLLEGKQFYENGNAD